MLEYIISDEKMIKVLTRNTKEVFDDTLEDLSQIIKKSNDSSHFRDDQDRNEYPDDTTVRPKSSMSNSTAYAACTTSERCGRTAPTNIGRIK